MTAATASADNFNSNASWVGYHDYKVTCQTNSDGTQTWAHVSVRMTVANTSSRAHRATKLRIKARLVPTTTGLDIAYPWNTNHAPAYGNLPKTGTTNRTFGVNTPRQGLGDWDVQVKLIWDRQVPYPDVVKEFPRQPLTGCGTGLLPAPTPAAPNSSSGDAMVRGL